MAISPGRSTPIERMILVPDMCPLGSQLDDATLAGGSGGGRGEPMGLDGLSVGGADPVHLSSHRVDEISVLADERIALGLLDRATPADVDHQLELGHLDRHPLAEEVEPNSMGPVQQA